MLDYERSFIETQFPVSKVSKESYKERMAGASQTLTGLGKWWGRKPLVLVRAAILGALLPVSDNPEKDREIFLKLMTMDEEGLYLRKNKNFTQKELYELCDRDLIRRYMELNDKGKPVYIKGIEDDEKELLQKNAFSKLTYDEKLRMCNRPEHIKNLPKSTWDEINEHLDTNADSFQSLVEELGMKRFGRRPKIGDVFSGGGSIPFEAARLGADVYASDLNPVASLLTWSSLNIAGASDEEIAELKEFQERVYNEVDRIVTELKIEHNEKGHRADSYLYCMETICPECGWKVPLAPSWVIGRGTKTIAILEDNGIDGFDIDIKSNVSKEDMKNADSYITVRGNNIYCPHCKMETPITSIRGDRKAENGETIYGLRLWEKNEFIPREDDVFQERLYCIRYVSDSGRYYIAPTDEDLKREEKVVSLLSERFSEWQEAGYIPSATIEDGVETTRLKRERGWAYWHQLFNPRQLLINGLFSKTASEMASGQKEKAMGLLGVNKISDWNCKLCRWDESYEKPIQNFYNQAFNTLYNYNNRGLRYLKKTWEIDIKNNEQNIISNLIIKTKDARDNAEFCDLWITDPPYADAVNYHELTEFFLAWDKALLERAFPEWYTDSKRILAVRGVGEEFNESMIEIYSNLRENMPDNGTQVVMFTHQDVRVWAELAMILWASGLRVSSAWTISTETATGGLKSGNYVTGTVLLTLKKQLDDDVIFPDELYDEIEYEVESMIDSMKDLNDKEDPDFNDADFILASYAAALKAITSYSEIAGIDVDYWLKQGRDSTEENPIEELIKKAQKIAYDYLIPDGFDKFIWRDLEASERFFIRGLELEMNNIYENGAYQELARGFGVKDYTDMFKSTKANETRFKTAEEFRRSNIGGEEFGSTLTRHLLVAINDSIKEGKTSVGISYLKNIYQEDNKYWSLKSRMIEILDFISRVENIPHMEHWENTGYYAKVLREALRNDGV
jgi:putative DNA methylase